jgi:flagella basal body P-ring formation protein FlgA
MLSPRPFAWLAALAAAVSLAAEAPTVTNAVQLLPQGSVHGQGVFLANVATLPGGAPVPALRLADAPPAGQPLVLSRQEILDRIREACPELAALPWTGPDRVQITRRTKPLDEAAVTALLTDALQSEAGGSRGEVELKLSRAWTTLQVPDDPLTLQLVGLPSGGLQPTMALRFDLRAANQTVGQWQTMARVKLLADVWVAQTTLRRGQGITSGDVKRERHDLLALRDALTELPDNLDALEVAQSLNQGAVLTSRALQYRPVVQRGHVVEGLLVEGSLTISLKVEVLENGVPGQLVRVRSLLTRKEIRGKVRDEQTIILAL